jgi:AcrR family transcriptional regulator
VKVNKQIFQPVSYETFPQKWLSILDKTTDCLGELVKKLEVMMEKEDRRVARTRRLLKAALIEVIDEQAYEKITIRDITDRADIGYATFFRHYDGVDGLMLEIFTGIIEEIESLPETHGEDYFEQEGYQLFEHVAKNRSLYRGILDSHTFTRKLRDHIRTTVRKHIDSHAEEISSSEIPIDVAAQHMVSSLLGLIDWWLAEDIPYPIERMAMIYDRLIIQATWDVLRS